MTKNLDYNFDTNSFFMFEKDFSPESKSFSYPSSFYAYAACQHGNETAIVNEELVTMYKNNFWG